MPYKVQVALKTNLDVFYFFIPCSLSVLFVRINNMGVIKRNDNAAEVHGAFASIEHRKEERSA